MLLLSGTDAAWAGVNGEVGTVTVNPPQSMEFGEVLHISSLKGVWSELYLVSKRGHRIKLGFEIFVVNLQPSWRMDMDVKKKMNIRELGKWGFPPLC